MKPLERSYQLAYAAGMDAGNRSMRRAGRKKWNDRDYAAAVKEFERIWPRPGQWKERHAEA
jgi:hypothetical protein